MGRFCQPPEFPKPDEGNLLNDEIQGLGVVEPSRGREQLVVKAVPVLPPASSTLRIRGGLHLSHDTCVVSVSRDVLADGYGCHEGFFNAVLA